MSFLVIKIDDRHLLYFDHMIVDPLNKDFGSPLGYNKKAVLDAGGMPRYNPAHL